ncbi:Spy/CpxP family protein refolding chaperone [Nitrospirillum pindoramense]|uniref:Spy/CpxP family protein refolding chaperone n=1 Tax=Nitrospirillum amazonense TaxID=28077 RepID=A0A560HG23_9PROT|nr:Spy/CpxP family protein refolding chaperone [Nitrospirillum amazonense]TWB44424.1 Spy/CpxP family protein refolding chaperone [Nitrospirillum amazonense]
MSRFRTQLLSTLAVGVFAVGVAAGAFAQDSSHSAPPPMAREHHRGGPWEHVDGRLAFLKAELKITAAQEGQWKKFETLVRADAEEMKQKAEKFEAEHKARWEKVEAARKAGQPVEPPAPPSLTERLDRADKMAAEHAKHISELKAVLTPLYASFTPEQKEKADTMLAHVIGPHGHHPGGGHHGFGGGRFGGPGPGFGGDQGMHGGPGRPGPDGDDDGDMPPPPAPQDAD